jgi:hypothetical protein
MDQTTFAPSQCGLTVKEPMIEPMKQPPKPNISLGADTQQQVAALRHLLRAGQL